MKILITNDDGIHAPGLQVLMDVAKALSDDVWVVAPESDQSGVGHALSLNDPLRLRALCDRQFALKGTPTDCVIMGVQHILPAKPDLILSGVNRGQNTAEDVTYSGTIAAAMEGTLLGIKSIALSQAYGFEGKENIHWETAKHHALSVLKPLIEFDLPKGTLLNVNFPNCLPQDVQGVRMCVQGSRNPGLLNVIERKDGRGHSYFWFGFAKQDPLGGVGSDLLALLDRYISVTPLKLDLTDEPTLTALQAYFDA